MKPSDNQQFTSSSLIVEGAIIGFLGANIFSFNTGWRWSWVFKSAFALLVVLYIIRAASTLVENPNTSRIRRTTPWSTIFFQICIIGAATNAATKLFEIHPRFDNLLLNFVLLTGFGLITVIVIDEVFLGAFLQTWIEIVRDNAGDNPVSEILVDSANWVEDILNTAGEGSLSNSFNYRRGFILIAILGTLFFAILSPFIYLGASVLGSTWISILTLLALMLVRDITRYIYLKLGPASDFTEVKTSTSMSMLVLLINVILVAGSLGIPF